MDSNHYQSIQDNHNSDGGDIITNSIMYQYTDDDDIHHVGDPVDVELSTDSTADNDSGLNLNKQDIYLGNLDQQQLQQGHLLQSGDDTVGLEDGNSAQISPGLGEDDPGHREDGAGHAVLNTYGNDNEEDDDGDDDHNRLLSKKVKVNKSVSVSFSPVEQQIQQQVQQYQPITPSKLDQRVTFNETVLKYSSAETEDVDDDASSLNESDFVSGDSHLFQTPTNIYERILTTASKLRFEASIHTKELKLTASYLACFISLGIMVGSLGPTLPSLAENTGSTTAQVGYFFSSRGIGYFMGSFTGRFYDRLKNGNLYVGAAIVLLAVSLLLIPLCTNIWLAGFLFFLEGIGGGVTDAGLNTMIVWIWKKNVNPFMQLLHFTFGIGALLAPFIVSIIVEQTLFVKYLVLSIIMILPFFPVIMLKSVPPYNEDTETGATLTKNEKRLRLEVVIAVAAFLFFYVGAEAGYGGWLFTYATDLLGLEDQLAGFLNSLFWTTFTLARLAGVFLSMYLTPNQMVILDMIGCFFFSILLIIFPNSVSILWIATSGLGISLASIFPTCISLPQNLNMPVTGEATSYMILGATLGEVTIPWLIGVTMHHFTPRALPWVVVVSCFITLGLYLAINIRAKIVRARDRGDKFELTSINQFISTIQQQA